MVAGGKRAGRETEGSARLLCGPHNSGRTESVDSLMRSHWGRAILLVPTQAYAQRRLENIILRWDLSGAWGRPVLTFEEFVAELLGGEGKLPARVGDFERRLLLQNALAQVYDKPSLAAVGEAAETRGFVSQMLRVITEIKQAAVDPVQFRSYVAAAKDPSWLDPVVADVYEAYQQALLAADVYDVPGMFWEAALMCRDYRPRRMEHIEALLLDGFDDFTPSEFNLLSTLRPHVKLLVFGLNCDTAPGRSDLYSIPLRTASRIEREFGAAIESFEAAEPRSCREYAASNIFWRDKPAPPSADLRRDLDIVPVSDAIDEIETICRRIKRIILNGDAAPGEIAVVYPMVGAFAATIRAVFDEFGVPVRIASLRLLWESSVGAFVLALLEALDEWQRDAVVDVLTSPWYRPGRPHTETIPALARTASIISGADEWQSRLRTLAGRVEREGVEETALERIPGAAGALHELIQAIDGLCALDSAFPRQATARGFAERLQQLLLDLKLAEAVQTHPVVEISATELAAVEALAQLLDTWGRWSNDTEQMARAAFISEFRRALQEVGFHPPQPQDAVVFMDAQGIRHLMFKHVFFAGVNEGDLPGPPRVSAVYSEQDLQNLARAGIELQGRYAHIEREMLLFHHVLCSATERLVISWRALSARGQEDRPSPYLNEILELFPGESLQAALPSSTDFVPPVEDAFSWRDARNAAFSAHVENAAALRPKFPEFEIAARIEQARHDLSPFGLYDGVLSDAGILRQLRDRFGRDHVFSVNQLEAYAECPFRFFIERVLRIEESEAPTNEFDSAVRGSILHDVLQQFHLRHRHVPACQIPPEADRVLDELIELAFDRHAWRSVNAPPAVVEVEKRHAKNLLLRYLHNERVNQEDDWKPSYFEAAFGRAYSDAECTLRSPEPFRLELNGEPALFAGRIDRIDLHDSHENLARIVDYKTSQVPQAKAINSGRSLQLALYALALENVLMKEARCAEAVFMSIGKNERRRLARGDDGWENCAGLCESIARCLEGIRAAKYAPAPPDADSACAFCSAKRVCRYETGRVNRKSGQRDAAEDA